MSATDLQSLLRFLTKDAKVPLATAMAATRSLQTAQLSDPSLIAKAKIDALRPIFPDEKQAKQVLNAAKRVSKKRDAGEPDRPSPAKRQRKDPFEVPGSVPAVEVEANLELRSSDLSAEELESMVFITNRAPLVLAFAATLVKHAMPEQPPSSRLSLAQAVVSMGSQSKAKYIGLKSGPTAEDEGWGKGQPTVKVMGRQISVLKRWGYEWSPPVPAVKHEGDDIGAVKSEPEIKAEDGVAETGESGDAGGHQPALWAIDLDQLKKLNGPMTFSAAASSDTAGLPVYSPQGARGYLYRSFDTAPSDADDDAAVPDSKPVKKETAASAVAKREKNVSCLLKALDLLIESWSKVLDPDELDRRAWSWYVAVRPDVEHGVAGWGAKGPLKLKDILDLRRPG